MAESDLDYAKVTGRFGLTVADGDDTGDLTDIIWCDEGTVRLTPLTTFTKVVGGSPVPWTAGHSVIDATIDSEGYLTHRDKRFVWVIDLTSEKVNSRIPDGQATHRVEFLNVRAGGTRVEFPSAPVRLTAAGPDGDGVNDLTKALPVPTGSAVPIIRGEQGTGIQSATVEGGELLLELTDGTEVNAGKLPVGPGGSDAGVADYILTPGTDTAAALSATFARVITPEAFGAIGNGVADDTAALTAAVAELIAGDTLFIRNTYLTTGSHTIPAGVTVDGSGKLKRSGASASELLTLGADVKVRNITLDGSATTQYVAIVGGDRVSFVGCGINDSDLYGIGNSSGYDDLTVRDCTFIDNDLYAVLIQGAAERNKITGCTVRNLVDGQGFFWKSTGTDNVVRPIDGVCANNIVEVQGTVAIEYWGDRGAVTGNVVRCGQTIGISIAIATQTSVTGNTVTYAGPTAAYGIEIAENSEHITVSGNTVVGATVGIIVSKGSRVTPSQHITVSGNTIRNSTSFGINPTFARRCVITGNLIDGAAGTAINVQNGDSQAHHLIANNTIIRRAAGSGIVVTGSYVTVTGNHIDGSLAPGGQGIAYGSGADYGLITGNHIISVTDGIVVSGTHCLIADNQTIGTTGNVVNMGAAADYNIVGSHYSQNSGGSQITVVGASSRLVGPHYNRGLNRTDTRTTRLGVDNSLAASTLGTLSKKVEVYDKAGASLGFVPVYTTIT